MTQLYGIIIHPDGKHELAYINNEYELQDFIDVCREEKLQHRIISVGIGDMFAKH